MVVIMMTSKQMQNGNSAENLVVELFREYHYWVHDMAKDATGAQPVDVVAIRGAFAGFGTSTFLVDAKNVRESEISLPFSRIESNQLSCMKYAFEWAGISKRNIGFVVVFDREPDKPRFLSYSAYLEMVKRGEKSANFNDMADFINVIK
jgi:hypothetical protein